MPVVETYLASNNVEYSILYYDFDEVECFRKEIALKKPLLRPKFRLFYRGVGGTQFYELNDGTIAQDGQTFAQIHSSYEKFSYYTAVIWDIRDVTRWPKRIIFEKVYVTDKIWYYSIDPTVGDMLITASKFAFGKGNHKQTDVFKIISGGYIKFEDDIYKVYSEEVYSKISNR